MLGDLEKTYSVIWRNRLRRVRKIVFGDLEKSCSTIWRNHVRRFGEIVRQFGEIVFGDLEKTLFGTVMVITYWSSSCSSIELGDRKWMLNHNRDKTETSYGDQKLY